MLYRFFALLLGLFSGAARSTNLSFALITSFGQYGTNSSGVVPAVDMALAEINSHSFVLRGYRLMYDRARDSQVSIAVNVERVLRFHGYCACMYARVYIYTVNILHMHVHTS